MGGCLTHVSRTVILILYDGKFSEGENFREFQGFVGYWRKFSPQNFGVWHPLVAPASNSQKFSPQNLIFYQFAKVFSLESFRYTVYKTFSQRGIYRLLPWQHHYKREMNNILVFCLGNKSYSPGLDGQMNIQSDRVTC